MPRVKDPKALQRFDAAKFIALLVLSVGLIGVLIGRGCQTFSDVTNLITPIPTYTFDLAVVRPVIIAPAGLQKLMTDTLTIVG